MAVIDKLEWHVGSAIERGQPPEQGFTHIGFFLAWLMRHGLTNPGFIDDAQISALRDGRLRPNEKPETTNPIVVPGPTGSDADLDNNQRFEIRIDHAFESGPFARPHSAPYLEAIVRESFESAGYRPHDLGDITSV